MTNFTRGLNYEATVQRCCLDNCQKVWAIKTHNEEFAKGLDNSGSCTCQAETLVSLPLKETGVYSAPVARHLIGKIRKWVAGIDGGGIIIYHLGSPIFAFWAGRPWRAACVSSESCRLAPTLSTLQDGFKRIRFEKAPVIRAHPGLHSRHPFCCSFTLQVVQLPNWPRIAWAENGSQSCSVTAKRCFLTAKPLAWSMVFSK